MKNLNSNRNIGDRFLFGGDYCPEQWPKEVWKEDIRLMKEASVNMVTIGVFNWALSQPDETTYTFEWLDEIMDMLAENDIMADLGTLTASPPAWMYLKYPEIRPVNEDGIFLNFGSRQTFCPNSSIYKDFSHRLVEKLAAHYSNHPALAMWHINNEFSHKVFHCFCDVCAGEFQKYVQKKYHTIENLNDTWGTAFWGQYLYNWNEIFPPRKTAQYVNPALWLDYRRFMTDTYLKLYIDEAQIVRKHTPDIPVTTNFLCEFKTMDYFRWGEYLDFVAVSSFPDPRPDTHPGYATLSHDLMRGIKHQKPFILLEQAPSHVTWRNFNSNKRPGVNRLWSYQGMAHGSDGFLFFQWRQSNKNAEKFHSAMVPHAGENTRIFKEIKQLGSELKNLSEIKGSRVKTSVCMLFDYNNWWSLEYFPGPTSELKYLQQIKNFSYPLQEKNITIDIQDQDGFNPDGYKMVVAPVLHLLKPGVAEKISRFVENGGVLVTTFYSGWVDGTDRVFDGGAPGPLKEVLGFTVEEFDVLAPVMENQVQLTGELSGKLTQNNFKVSFWADVLQLTTAKPLAVFTQDYYKDKAAVTVNRYGKGFAYYIGADIKDGFVSEFLDYCCSKHSIQADLNVPVGVEVVTRTKEGKEYIFLLNHAGKDVKIELPEGEYLNLISNEKLNTSFSLINTDVKILVKT
jgi:beta-galactosidase